jgi:predicted nucleotidyltransferase
LDQATIETITRYRHSLESLGIGVKKIILFGSRARGLAVEYSDIDLLVVSDDFRNMDTWERMRLLGRARVGIKAPMEIFGCTEDEIASEPPGTFMGNEAIAKGIEIVA